MSQENKPEEQVPQGQSQPEEPANANEPSSPEQEQKPDQESSGTPGDPTTQQVSVEELRKTQAQRPKQTEMLNLPKDFKPMPNRDPQPGTALLGEGWRLIFRIGDQKKALTIKDRILIGRSLEQENDPIGFDLTPFGAYHFGVSRQHAALTLKDGYLYLEDMGSTNGTRINGFQLTAHQKYRLRDGDEIEFARLRTSVRFRSPEGT